MKHRASVFAAALTALALGVGACSSPSNDGTATADSTDLSKVTLRVGDQVAGTESVLAAAGKLDDVPYEIEWSSFTSGPPQIEALNAGQIDFAITGNTPPIIGGPTRTKVVSAYADDGIGEAILVAPDSDIKSVNDLKGRSIAVARGSSAHGLILLQLAKAGLNTKDVELNFLQPADAKAAFQGGEVDAWAIWDPYTALAEIEGARPIANDAEVTKPYNFGSASDKTLADPAKEAALADLLARVRDAYAWAEAHPDEWASKYAAESGFNLEAAKLNTRSQHVSTPLDNEVIDVQNNLINAFAEDEILKKFDFSSVVDRRFES